MNLPEKPILKITNSHRSIIKQIEKLMPQIEIARDQGFSLGEIIHELNQLGLKISYGTLSIYLHRIKIKQQTKTGEKSKRNGNPEPKEIPEFRKNNQPQKNSESEEKKIKDEKPKFQWDPNKRINF